MLETARIQAAVSLRRGPRNRGRRAQRRGPAEEGPLFTQLHVRGLDPSLLRRRHGEDLAVADAGRHDTLHSRRDRRGYDDVARVQRPPVQRRTDVLVLVRMNEDLCLF